MKYLHPHPLRLRIVHRRERCHGFHALSGNLNLIVRRQHLFGAFALSGGFYPVSAVLSNSDVLGVLKPGQHGSTFGGNPLACAIARAALRVLTEENMIENSRIEGEYFLQQLKGIRSNIVREVRGRGLMLAIELHPEAGGANRFCYELKERGILAKDTHGDTIRIAPPLVINRDQIDWALEQFNEVLTSMN